MERSAIRERLRLSSETMETLKNCIRSADEITRDWLTVIIANYQVYYSRSERLIPSAPVHQPNGENVFAPAQEDALIDWATFHALTEHIFPFARPRGHPVSETLDVDRIRSAFFIANYGLYQNELLQKRLGTRLETIADGKLEHFLIGL